MLEHAADRTNAKNPEMAGRQKLPGLKQFLAVPMAEQQLPKNGINGECCAIDLRQLSAMQTMNISLPDPMKQYVEEQVSMGGYSSASEYVRQLVRADQKRRDKEQLEQLLVSSLNSGGLIKITPEMLEDVRRRLRARAKIRKSAKS